MSRNKLSTPKQIFPSLGKNMSWLSSQNLIYYFNAAWEAPYTDEEHYISRSNICSYEWRKFLRCYYRDVSI